MRIMAINVVGGSARFTLEIEDRVVTHTMVEILREGHYYWVSVQVRLFWPQHIDYIRSFWNDYQRPVVGEEEEYDSGYDTEFDTID